MMLKILFEHDLILYEQTLLKSEKLNYSISYFPKIAIYDVVIEDFNEKKLVSYQSFSKLSNSTLKYFNLLRDEEYSDAFGNNFRCISHIIEFEL